MKADRKMDKIGVALYLGLVFVLIMGWIRLPAVGFQTKLGIWSRITWRKFVKMEIRVAQQEALHMAMIHGRDNGFVCRPGVSAPSVEQIDIAIRRSAAAYHRSMEDQEDLKYILLRLEQLRVDLEARD